MSEEKNIKDMDSDEFIAHLFYNVLGGFHANEEIDARRGIIDMVEDKVEKIKSLESRLSQAEAELKIHDIDISGMTVSKDGKRIPLKEIFKSARELELEQRLSQAEAEKDTWITQCAHHETQLIALNTRLSHLMDVAKKLAEWVEGYVDYLGHENCGNECQHGQMSKEMKALIAEWDGIKEGGK